MQPIRCYQAAAAACVLLFAQACFGWAENWEDLRAAAGKISSIRATFVQEKHMKVLVRPLVSEGLLYFQAPGSLRWEYRYPIESILVSHAGKTQKYIRKDGKLVADAAASAPALQFVTDEISRWLKGSFDENPIFSASLQAGSRIILTPKDKSFGHMIQRIELVLSKRPGVMDAVIVYESEDSFTRIQFMNVEINQPLDRRLFEEVQ